ncbi:MAG: hypothetical protein GY856_54005 [bacterium]|nr:hypothetical protein [bacterium]
MTEPQSADLEELAAFIDGRLSGELKARVEERLLRDEGYYEIFLDTVRFRQEHDAASDAVPVPIRRRRTWRLAVPLAAAALLVILINFMDLGGRASTNEWVAQLDTATIVAQEGWDDPGWSRLRTANIPEGRYRPEELAFRLGVRAVDLRVALTAQDREQATRLAAMLEQLAEAADLFPVSSAYRDLRGQLESVEPGALVAQAAEIERWLSESFEDGPLEARRLALGAWSEAGRLAALSRDVGALVDVFREDPGIGSIDEIATEIATLEALLDRSDLGDEDFDAAVAAFKQIVIALAG